MMLLQSETSHGEFGSRQVQLNRPPPIKQIVRLIFFLILAGSCVRVMAQGRYSGPGGSSTAWPDWNGEIGNAYYSIYDWETDSDGDGVPDFVENACGSDPNNWNSTPESLGFTTNPAEFSLNSPDDFSSVYPYYADAYECHTSLHYCDWYDVAEASVEFHCPIYNGNCEQIDLLDDQVWVEDEQQWMSL